MMGKCMGSGLRKPHSDPGSVKASAGQPQVSFFTLFKTWLPCV